ncbi:MAG TPA: 16S rRNA (adenine(1518)-N(6)/adenine(1519)-N(6))-dimethyltransferase RsmA [Pyrinomonadaceae bacterium]|nr:16S rRNA (adenine(1518)-N(6)/adenine(1519)-N(6))-dimethyltransferase RsmA [Pyrinomonadaceae bacterium]
MKNEEKSKPFAKKSFGQNFLVDQNYISKIISVLDPKPNETIIEIGAGRGALTGRLVESGADIFAIELDKDLIPLLRNEFGENENFNLVEEDALKINFAEITKTKDQRPKTKLVANLPYYISTAILQKLARQREAFSELILMFQREVVGRITAEPGNKERGFLTVLVEAFFQAEKLFDVPPTAFRPIPKVWSSVVRLTTKNENVLRNEKLFLKIISAGFQQKRKTILNNLKNAPESLYKEKEIRANLQPILENLEINPQRRAETLTLKEWIKLTNFFGQKNV